MIRDAPCDDIMIKVKAEKEERRERWKRSF